MTATATDTFDVLDPATGEVIATLDHGDPEAAVAAARAAFPGWARTAPAERAALLKAGARRLREHLEELAELQTREGGKPLDDSRGGVEAGIGAIEQYAELGPLHRGRALQGSWDATDVMVHEPRGVVALLVPWNDPVAIACGQIAAALVTGNAVVFKPSEKTPLTGARIVERLDIPALHLLQGDARVGRPLAAHPDVDLVMHTGSVQTGKEIADVVAGRLGKALLELGGKDALIVDEDVDPEWAAAQAALGAFANAGQICTSVERIYVHETVAEPFIEALEREAHGWTIGPLIDARQRELVHGHVTDAAQRGAEVRCGGEIPDGPGFFYPPTVLVGGDADAPVLREETFGPVAAVQVVSSFDQALELADRTDYGLAATVLTKSPAHAQRAARELAVGTVKINAVFGGAPGGAAEPARLSGSGFGYGPELLDELTRTKVVHMGIAP
ncbi:MAG TPA: aldehyde dehydrogenase family protein [Solirubrobacteraceae bacterium]|nr:aldehyde dehydrogenase family protein [Solirubrobacteraceae bacterium]